MQTEWRMLHRSTQQFQRPAESSYSAMNQSSQLETVTPETATITTRIRHRDETQDLTSSSSEQPTPTPHRPHPTPTVTETGKGETPRRRPAGTAPANKQNIESDRTHPDDLPQQTEDQVLPAGIQVLRADVDGCASDGAGGRDGQEQVLVSSVYVQVGLVHRPLVDRVRHRVVDQLAESNHRHRHT